MKLILKNINKKTTFVIFVLPLLLSMWVFVFPWSAELEPTMYSSKDFSLDRIKEFNSIESDYKKNIKKFISGILHIPFDFKTMIFCFEDVGSYYEYESTLGLQRFDSDFYWKLKLGKEETWNISHGEKKCEKIKITDDFVPSLILEGVISNETIVKNYELNVTFVKDTRVFGKKNIEEVVKKSIIFILGWFVLILLLMRLQILIKKVKNNLFGIFIVFMVPLLLCVWFFVFPWNTEFESTSFYFEDSPEDIKEGIKVEFSSIESEFKKTTKNFMTEVLNIHFFEFETLMFCFEDKGSYGEEETPQGFVRFDDEFYWLVNLPEEDLFVYPNKKKCGKLDLTKEYPPPITMKVKVTRDWVRDNADPFIVNFKRNTNLFGRKNTIEVIQKSITLILSWMVLMLLFTETWTFAKKKKSILTLKKEKSLNYYSGWHKDDKPVTEGTKEERQKKLSDVK